MTGEGDSAPETDTGGPGRRRPRVDAVGAELAALRRDVDQHGGLLAEALPRLDDLTDGVGELRAVVRSLVDDAEDQAAADQADLQARRAAGLADEPPAPWCWSVMDRGTARAAWDALARWVDVVLCREQQLPLRRLPACWPAHPAAVAELSAVRAAHVAAVRRGAHPAAGLSWQRELPLALDRLSVVVPADRCPPLLHEVDPERRPQQRELDRVGAIPCSLEHWRRGLDTVVARDLSGRREAPP